MMTIMLTRETESMPLLPFLVQTIPTGTQVKTSVCGWPHDGRPAHPPVCPALAPNSETNGMEEQKLV